MFGDRILGRRRDRDEFGGTRGPSVWKLTELGRTKADTYSRDPRMRLLVALDEKGPSTPLEIARAAGLGQTQTKRLLEGLEGRYVSRHMG